MTGTSDSDRRWMAEALQLAEAVRGTTHPNPHVGAVIVEKDRLVAWGATEPAGGRHAEIVALDHLDRHPGSDAVLYVTLEPCSTHGRTPPCTEAILAAGIRRVVVGATDPNPAHAGSGLTRLRDAGITVDTGILAEACADTNLLFNHWIRTRRPLLALKVATTLDGYLATANGDSRWVTGPEAREHAMGWRRYFPALVSGAGTVLADNPRFTARPVGQPESCPLRLILDSKLRTAAQADALHVYTDAFATSTRVFHTAQAPAAARQSLEGQGIALTELPTGDDGRVDLGAFRDWLAGQPELVGAYIEAGADLSRACWAAGLVDYLMLYQAPKLLLDRSGLTPFGGRAALRMSDAVAMTERRTEAIGPDCLIRGFIQSPEETAS
ncbi:MAG: bifunctional diaminohydroxyphosphoribosylaminopyrimidine deaminase/5-amino-6-(5-phosphoribosylamino)uracil reductase RibD [Opitutales bacterium]